MRYLYTLTLSGSNRIIKPFATLNAFPLAIFRLKTPLAKDVILTGTVNSSLAGLVVASVISNSHVREGHITR